MKVGTAEPLEETDKKKRARKSGFTGGAGPKNGGRGRGGGGGGGNDGGGGGGFDSDHESAGTMPEKSRILTAFLLLVVTMTFGGLMAAYIVIATNRAIEWRPFDLPLPVWISTAIILFSSLTYHFANQALAKEDQPRAKKWLTLTCVLGAAFIASQLLAWLELYHRGLYFSGNPYAGFFYILTGIHAAHVLGGVIALGAVVLRAWDPRVAESNWPRLQVLGQTVGWYWHFMDGVWVLLFILLGFWK